MSMHHWRHRLYAPAAVGILFLSVVAISKAATQAAHSFALDTAAQNAVDRLGAIAEGLPDGAWKYHAGDIPHGEDVGLDDSQWQSGSGDYVVGDGSIWFRRTLVLPVAVHGDPIRGSRIFFQFHAKAHGGVSEIVYLNGRRIALGESLEPVLLTQRAVPGETMHLAVKLLHSRSDKRIAPATYTVMFPDDRPDPAILRAEILAASALLPSLRAASSAQLGLPERAALRIDVAALDRGDERSFDDSLRAAQRILDPLRPLLQTLDLRLIGNSHIDTAWLWPWTETVDVVHRTFSTSLQLMSEYPNYKYTQSVALYAEWMQQKYPDIFAEMKQRTREGRWEPVGGMWVEPDLNMPDGESLVRQLLIGKNFFRKQMGVDIRIGWNPDSFGYTWQLPQIYKKSGIDFFVTQKMAWNETNQLPLKLFWWQSPDGSRVLTYFPHSYELDPDPVLLADDLAHARKLAPGEDTLMHLYGVGDHGGGPTRMMLDQAQRWMQPDKSYPHVQYSTAASFFADVAPKVETPVGTPVWNYRLLAREPLVMPTPPPGKINIPVWNDELYLEYHRGAYTTQAKHKQNMRQAEEEMLNTEKVASINWLGGQPYPSEELNEAWKKVLVNQFHDLAAGTGVAAVYADAQSDYDSVHRVTDEITQAALENIASHADTTGSYNSTPLFVFNPLAWKRTGLVEAEVQLTRPVVKGIQVIAPNGRAMLTQILSEDRVTGRYRLLIRAEDVPPLGYVVLHVRDGAPDNNTDLMATGTVLENERLKMVVDRSTGCITHLIDKSTGFDAISSGGCGNELQTFVDVPKKYDAWNIDADALTKMTPIHSVDSIRLIENGPLRATLRIERHWGKSKFVQCLRLSSGQPEIEVANDFDWEETHVLLKAAFPLAASAPEATYEIPYGSIQRPTTRTNPIGKAMYEVPALRWADLGNGAHGFSLLNASKYGYDAAGNVLRLSLLRSPVYPDPHADRGRQKFVYALYPHAGTWQHALTVRRGYELNYPLQAFQTAPHVGTLPAAHSFLSVEGDAVVLTAVKKAEDSNSLILRFYEWQGKPSTVHIVLPGAPVSAELVGMMEDDTHGSEQLQSNLLTTRVKPYEIQTIRVDYGNRATNRLWETHSTEPDR